MMGKILYTNPIFKLVEMSNHLKSFRPFKICYYLQMIFPKNHITHRFPRKLTDSSAGPKDYWSLL